MKNILFAFLLPLNIFAQQQPSYKNLALEGGGIRGIAYAGVISVLEQKNILHQIEKVAGSSVGAIAGLMIAVGYSANELDSLLMNLNIEQFNDGKGGAIGKYKRVKNNFGIYKGDRFENWLKGLVAFKTGKAELSFKELHVLHLNDPTYKDLYVTATNLSKQRLEIFSQEHTPDMPIALAVRVSAGIPFYFEPIVLNNVLERIERNDSVNSINYYVDGGMLCNYPISMFDTCSGNTNPLLCSDARFNPATLGIKLERPEQIDSLNQKSITIPPYDPDNLQEYFLAFSNLLMETLARKYPKLENEIGRTMYVSDGNISPRVRKIKQEEKRLLYNNGVEAALSYFK